MGFTAWPDSDEKTVECKSEYCQRMFESKMAMRSHYRKSHSGDLVRVEKTCPTCQETFTENHHADKTYCSTECAPNGEKEYEQVCPTCDESFSSQPAKDQTYCCWDCYVDDWHSVHDKS